MWINPKTTITIDRNDDDTTDHAQLFPPAIDEKKNRMYHERSRERVRDVRK